MKPRTILLSLLALLLVPPVLFVGGCLVLAVGAGILNYRDDANDQEAAAADTRLQRPHVSTSGRILFIAQKNGTNAFYVANVAGSGSTPPSQLQHASTIVRPSAHVWRSTEGVLIVPVDRPSAAIRLDRPGGWLAWAPDGKQLASLSLDFQKRFRLYLFNADGSGEVRDIAASWPRRPAATSSLPAICHGRLMACASRGSTRTALSP